MLTLSNFRNFRVSRDIPRPTIAAITGIDLDRLRALELRRAEPWFDEALLLSRCLCLPGVASLVAATDLTGERNDPAFFAADINHWRAGVRLPLSLAFRLARRFGLERVDDLAVAPLLRQVWSVLEASERHPDAPGWCPWCQSHITAGAAHEPHCLPHNLMGPRTLLGNAEEAAVGASRPARAGVRRGSSIAHGLRALRKSKGLTQARMAAITGCASNHYARLERGDLPLTLDAANQLVAAFNVDLATLYTRPTTLPIEESGRA